MTTNKEHADALRARIDEAVEYDEKCLHAALLASIALLDPPQTTDAAEREHCEHAAEDALPYSVRMHAPAVADTIRRERAAVRTEWCAKALASAANAHELRAENERLTARCLRYENSPESAGIAERLYAKHTALVKAARAYVHATGGADQSDAHDALLGALKGEPEARDRYTTLDNAARAYLAGPSVGTKMALVDALKGEM